MLARHTPPDAGGGRGAQGLALGGICAALAIFAFYTIRQLIVVDLALGGNVWKQGDWLINREEVAVRRGPLGSWIIDLADLLSVDPLSVVIGVQALLVALVVLLLLRIVFFVGQPVLLAILLTCPGLFLIAWVADPQGAVRKELLAFAAILLALWGLQQDRALGTAFGGLGFGVAVFGNEANILFLPLFLGLFWWGSPAPERWHRFGRDSGLVLSGFALWYALNHLSIPRTDPVCAPLLARGLPPDICTGAIAWLADSPSDARLRIADIHGDPQTLITMALVYLAAMVPLAFVIGHLQQWRLALGLAVLSGLPFIPLYFVGLDWGRWLGLHVFSVVIVILAGLGAGRFTLGRRPSFLLMLAFVFVSLLWAPNHEHPGIQAQWFRGAIWHVFGDVL